MKTIYLMLLAGLIFSTAGAQSSFSGKILDWDMGEALIVKPDFMGNSNEPERQGLINADGSFNIPLVEISDFNTDEQSDPEGQWSSRRLNLNEAFTCYSGDLQYENAAQPVANLSTMGVFELSDSSGRENIGFFMPVSSKEFASYFSSFGQENAVNGYTLDYYYVSQPAKISGSCSIESYVHSGENYIGTTHYELDLKPGWNLIKYEVVDLFTDKDGRAYAKDVKYASLDALPSDASFVFIKN